MPELRPGWKYRLNSNAGPQAAIGRDSKRAETPEGLDESVEAGAGSGWKAGKVRVEVGEGMETD